MGISCEEVWRDLSDYIDGELHASQQVLLDVHFAECRHCAAVLEGTRNVIQVYRDERILAMPEAFRERLQETLRERTATPRRSFLAWALAAAAALPLGFGLYSILSSLKRRTSLPVRDTAPVTGLVAVSQDEKIKVFHIAGCPKLQGKPKFLPVEKALHDGYTPCPYCIGKARQEKKG
jgi:anti-sigma factor RsiW